MPPSSPRPPPGLPSASSTSFWQDRSTIFWLKKKMILGLLGSTAVYQIIYYIKRYFLVLILDHTSSKKIMLKHSTSTTFDVDIGQEYIPCCKLIFFYTDKNYYWDRTFTLKWLIFFQWLTKQMKMDIELLRWMLR